MPLDLLPSAQHLDHPKSYGGTYVTDVPWRLVFHTTEAVPSNVSGAVSMAKRHANPPHLWAWPEKNWLAQTVLLTRSAFALKTVSPYPSFNKMRSLQVEVIGFAKDSPGKPDEWWEWLGEEVAHPLIEAGYPINLDHLAPLTGADGYGEHGSVRFTQSQWRNFDGICAHSNVPKNSHWDIGDGRLDLIAQAARPESSNPEPNESGDINMEAAILLLKRYYDKKRGKGDGAYDPQFRDPNGFYSWLEELLKAQDAGKPLFPVVDYVRYRLSEE